MGGLLQCLESVDTFHEALRVLKAAPVSGAELLERKLTTKLIPSGIKGEPLQVPGKSAGGGHGSLCLVSFLLQMETSACNFIFLDMVSCLH